MFCSTQLKALRVPRSGDEYAHAARTELRFAIFSNKAPLLLCSSSRQLVGVVSRRKKTGGPATRRWNSAKNSSEIGSHNKNRGGPNCCFFDLTLKSTLKLSCQMPVRTPPVQCCSDEGNRRPGDPGMHMIVSHAHPCTCVRSISYGFHTAVTRCLPERQILPTNETRRNHQKRVGRQAVINVLEGASFAGSSVIFCFTLWKLYPYSVWDEALLELPLNRKSIQSIAATSCCNWS
jgi:hypothetical protein